MFPIWIATKPDGRPVVVGSHDLRYLAAFVTAGGAEEFMRQAGEAGWEFKLVNSAAFRGMVAELRRQGLLGVCFNTAGGGTKVSFDELAQDERRLLMAVCRQAQQRAGEAPFVLSCRMAGDLVGVHYKVAWRWLRHLVDEEILQEVSPGTLAGYRATRFRYLGD